MKTFSFSKISFVFIFLLFFAAKINFAQQITFSASNYAGYNVTCHGASTASVDATISDGTSPYSYSWAGPSGFTASTEDITGLAAGSYTLTVTDSLGHSSNKSITLTQPQTLAVQLSASNYNGYGIAIHGGSSGTLSSQVSGGATPYSYLWSNSDTHANILGLAAGTYTLTVTDQNGCTVSDNHTLTQPSALQITGITASNHNGHSVSCNKGDDGSIILSVSGGVTQYSYNWSNGSFSQNPNRLGAGSYSVIVTDANGAQATDSITLTEPNKLSVELTTSQYFHYNCSCSGCTDGTINTTVTGGTSSFTYLWENSTTTANRTGLGVGDSYNVTVTDANGCTAYNETGMTEPAGGAWSLHGNPGDSTYALGTTDNKPLVLKTNNTERMRIAGDGKMGIGTASPTEKLDVNGNLRVHGYMTADSLNIGSATNNFQLRTFTTLGGGSALLFGTIHPPPPFPGCIQVPVAGNLIANRYSVISGTVNVLDLNNDGTTGFIDYGVDVTMLGTSGASLKINSLCGTPTTINENAGNVSMCTGTSAGNVFMCTSSGTVSIGSSYTNANYKLAVDGKIIATEVHVKAYSSWPDYVFDKKYKLRTIDKLKEYTTKEKHLPEMPTAAEVEKEGVNVSEMITKLLKQQEELTQYIIQLNEQNKDLKKEIELLKKGK